MAKINYTAQRIYELLAKAETLSNYNDTEIKASVESLRTSLDALKTRLDTLIGSGDVTTVIDTFNEIEAFLQGVTNTQTLTGLLQEMKTEIVALIPTNTVDLATYNALAARVAALESTAQTHGTSISTLQTDISKRPAVPASDDCVYGIYNGAYVSICDADEQLLANNKTSAQTAALSLEDDTLMSTRDMIMTEGNPFEPESYAIEPGMQNIESDIQTEQQTQEPAVEPTEQQAE